MRLSFYLASVISALAAQHYMAKAVKLDHVTVTTPYKDSQGNLSTTLAQSDSTTSSDSESSKSQSKSECCQKQDCRNLNHQIVRDAMCD